MYDFANILFAGPCNRRCPWCIGNTLPDHVNEDNLDLYPLRGMDSFVSAVNEHSVREVVFTGTITDPQLYRHEARLLVSLRRRLHPRVRFSVHTNGVRALQRLEVFNLYDRACISFPSFNPDTYERMMGSRRVPDLDSIVRLAAVPVKVSCVVDEPNRGEIGEFLERCRMIGIRRVVLRTMFGAATDWSMVPALPLAGEFRGNPVLDYRGMEVTLWDFSQSDCRSLNLFADGTLGTSYLLTRTQQLGLTVQVSAPRRSLHVQAPAAGPHPPRT